MDLEEGVQFPLRISVTLAQLVERLTFNQVVMGSSPICDNLGMKFDGLNSPVVESRVQVPSYP